MCERFAGGEYANNEQSAYLCARWMRRRYTFRFEARTSRGTLQYRDAFYLRLWDKRRPQLSGIGECALFRGLSAEDTPEYENILDQFCNNPTAQSFDKVPSSVRFGAETAWSDLQNGATGMPRSSAGWTDGTHPVPINGLVWMADKHTMYERIKEKLEQGFNCLKLKIGAIGFEEELELLAFVRSRFSSSHLQLRVDANGAFTPDNVEKILRRLAPLQIHSVEQPIKPGQPDAMRKVCTAEIIPIALDEELIGMTDDKIKHRLLQFVCPQYVILKPSLCGGFGEADKWIETAEKLGIGWWATSALESNVGLNAIGAWLSMHSFEMCQGLGTGEVLSQNIPWYVYRKGENVYGNGPRPQAGILLPELFV